MKEKNNNKRREILALGMAAGAGILGGSGINKIISNFNSEEKVKMLTPDGELVEVDVRHLPKTPRKKPVSNAELKGWMNKE